MPSPASTRPIDSAVRFISGVRVRQHWVKNPVLTMPRASSSLRQTTEHTRGVIPVPKAGGFEKVSGHVSIDESKLDVFKVLHAVKVNTAAYVKKRLTG